MCGIAGIVGPAARAERDVVLRMSDIQRHRGPDGDGIFVSDDAVLGHVRLAVLDLSPAGHQPMSSPDGRYTIVHNGEVYNYLELRRELADTGPFTTNTDTEVILRAFMQWGPACLDRCVGMFAFAIWDDVDRRLFAARDRFGIKPFYYAERDGTVVFASEVKALFLAGVPRRPNFPVIHDYLARGHYEHADETFFADVTRLLPGHYVIARPGQPATRWRYYSLPDQVPEATHTTEQEAAAALRGLLRDAVDLRLRSDVPVGISLSGGLDSSTLVALTDELSRAAGQYELFSCVYDEERYSERPWIEAVAQAAGRSVDLFTMRSGDAWNWLPFATWHQDEPFGGVPAVAWTGMYERVRSRGVTVLLDGSGLDDILGGYRSHHLAFLADQAAAGTATFAQELAAYSTAWRVSAPQALVDLEHAVGTNAATLALDASNPVRADCISPALTRLSRPLEPFPAPFATGLKNVMYRGLTYTKIPRALRFKDRMSMAFARELRVPFLDHRLVEFCFGLPDCLLMRNGVAKHLLREAMRGSVPDNVRLAPKRSVPTPQREWLAGPLRPQVEEILGSRSFASREVLDPKKVQHAYRQYCEGSQDNSFYVWQWINLEHWFRTFIDQPPISR